MQESKIESLSQTRMAAEIFVPWEKVAPLFQKTLSEIKKSVNIPGFRSGKAPNAMVIKRYKDYIGAELAKEVATDALLEEAEKQDINLLGIESIDNTEIKEKEHLFFSAILEVMPSIEAQDLEDIEIEGLELKTTAEEVEEHLQKLAEHASKTEELEKAVEEGDEAVLGSLTIITDEGETLSDEEGTRIELKGDQAHETLAKKLIGAEPGDTMVLNLGPEDKPIYPDQAGKSVKVYVDVQKVLRTVTKEVNEEFAKERGQESLQAWREATLKDLQGQKEKQEKDRREATVLEKIVKPYKFELPQGMVFDEAKAMTQQIIGPMQHLIEQNPELQKHVQGLFHEYLPVAETRVKTTIVLDALAKKMGIEASVEELIEELDKNKESIDQQTYDRVKEQIEEGKKVPLAEIITKRKTLAKIMEGVKVKVVEELTPMEEEAETEHVHGPDCDHDHEHQEEAPKKKKATKKAAKPKKEPTATEETEPETEKPKKKTTRKKSQKEE